MGEIRFEAEPMSSDSNKVNQWCVDRNQHSFVILKENVNPNIKTYFSGIFHASLR